MANQHTPVALPVKHALVDNLLQPMVKIFAFVALVVSMAFKTVYVILKQTPVLLAQTVDGLVLTQVMKVWLIVHQHVLHAHQESMEQMGSVMTVRVLWVSPM
jgi:hypothetical protein